MDAYPRAARALEPASFSLQPRTVPILAAHNATETSGSAIWPQEDEEGRTEDDQLSLYLPIDNTWSDPPLTNPDGDESTRYTTGTSSASFISRIRSFATASTSANSLSTNYTAWCSTAAAPTSRSCSACHRRISGQFVRALGTVFHFDCFRCADCGTEVASGYFPLQGSDGKQQPLCEKDHFRRLDLTCARCKQPLKDKTCIAACNKKFHAEHFTCSVCPELLKPQGAWKRNGDVYCHRHYSIWSPTNCTGCWTFVADPFVESGPGSGQRWHQECYLLNKFWDIRLATTTVHGRLHSESEGHALEAVQQGASAANETQMSTEALAVQIWGRISEYEESSLACLSDIPGQVSNDMYLDAIRSAEKLVLHIEVLFAAIDELGRAGAENLHQSSHAESLFQKTFSLIVVLSGDQDHSFESNSVQFEIRQERTVQELRALTPSLAFHHKNLIIDTLNDAFQLQRNKAEGNALLNFLDRLQRFALDRADPNADRQLYPSLADETTIDDSSSDTTDSSYPRVGEPFRFMALPYYEGVAYGYESLAPHCAGTSPTSHNYPVQVGEDGILMLPSPPNNTCIACLRPIEEGCARAGTYERWHLHCLACATCGKSAGSRSSTRDGSEPTSSSEASASPEPSGRLNFGYGFFPELRVHCTAHMLAGTYYIGFKTISRLEQYAFSLNVAIRRSHYTLLNQGDICAVAVPWYESD